MGRNPGAWWAFSKVPDKPVRWGAELEERAEGLPPAEAQAVAVHH